MGVGGAGAMCKCGVGVEVGASVGPRIVQVSVDFCAGMGEAAGECTRVWICRHLAVGLYYFDGLSRRKQRTSSASEVLRFEIQRVGKYAACGWCWARVGGHVCACECRCITESSINRQTCKGV